MREISLSQAVNEALAEEMRRDPTTFILGEDVAEAGTPFKVLSGLVEEFGTERVIATPISEPGFMGIAVGAALTGARPTVDLMFGDFLYLIMDQLCNQAAKAYYMSGGKLNVPLVVRTNLGATRRSAAQHSQSLHALVAHIPGLKVAMPSSAYEAKGLMKTAIRDNNPVVIFEDKLMYNDKAPVPEEDAAGIGQKDQPCNRRGRRPPELWRHRRDCQPDQRKGILSSRRAGVAHGGDGRAGAVQPGTGGSDGSHARRCCRKRPQTVRRGHDPCCMT